MRLENFLEKLSGVRQGSEPDSWVALCPGHDDKHPSLSIKLTPDETILLKCHAGCTVKQITDALGLKLGDLFATKFKKTEKTTWNAWLHKNDTQFWRNVNMPQEEKKETEQYSDSWEELVAQLEKKYGSIKNKWLYQDNSNNVIGVVLRWDKEDGKVIRPISKHEKGWKLGAMPNPRPLFGLKKTETAETIFVVEGEKCAEKLQKMGVPCVTSSGGAQAAAKTDWSPLRGKLVIIIPDNDKAGKEYAEQVAKLCLGVGAHKVKIFDLKKHAPELPEGGDIFDLLEGDSWFGAPLDQSATVKDFKNWLYQTADKIDEYKNIQELDVLDSFDYHEFPISSLPNVLCDFVRDGAESIGCDYSYLALPLLASLGGAIGNTWRLELKQGWQVPPIIWAIVIGESGTAKTPAFRLIINAVREKQAEAFAEHAKAMEIYEEQLRQWESKPKKQREEKPSLPQCDRYIVADTTIEALAPILEANPRGLLLARDELAGWVNSFDRYSSKNKTGADLANWLSMFNGEQVIVDRKSNNKVIHVPRATISVTGGIQPGILKKSLTNEYFEAGLAARLLMAWPDRQPKKWTETGISKEQQNTIKEIFDRLYSFELIENEPQIVKLSGEAKKSWIEYYNTHAEEQLELDSTLSAAWSKLEEYAARIALILHFAKWATAEIENPYILTNDTIQEAIKITTWFKNEAKRIYALLSESEEETTYRQLIEFLKKRNNEATVREIQRGVWAFRGQNPTQFLEQLRLRGIGNWAEKPTGKQGGRPCKVFRLTSN